MTAESHERLSQLNGLLNEESLPLHGCCAFDAVAGRLQTCRASERLKAAFPSDSPPRTVIAALFPYRRGDMPSNLARYARVPDYHIAAGKVLERAAGRLQEAFPPHRFLPFIDNSPIPEVKAASLAGLGRIGDNGLLIHPEYGSWVFIGTIATDMAMPVQARSVAYCPHCGRCSSACPGRCLENSTRDTCVSHISQKKGALSPEEERLLRGSGMAWGCDICQEVCPLNAHARIKPHPCFEGDYTSVLTNEALENLTGKAYGWRGQAVPRRNLSLFDEDWK